MHQLVKTSEIGKSTMVTYRAKVLGIEPAVNNRGRGENLYYLSDVDKILGYKPKSRWHNISHYKTLEAILNNDKLRYNVPYAAKYFQLKQSKIQDMLDEYSKTGCFITGSKINNL